jgi:hypothetical protein
MPRSHYYSELLFFKQEYEVNGGIGEVRLIG